jgi:hypothetical protein
MRRTITATLLGAFAVASGLVGLGDLSSLWADYQDSPDSFYVLSGVPLAAAAVAAVAGSLSLYATRGRRLLITLGAVALAAGIGVAVYGAITFDSSHWGLVAWVGVPAVLFFGASGRPRMRPFHRADPTG